MLFAMSILRRAMLTLLPVVLVLTGAAPATAAPVAASVRSTTASSSSQMTADQARAEMLNLINTARANHGLRAVTLDPRVADVAQARSDDMATNHYFSHIDSATWIAMFSDRGIAWSSLGEILAYNDKATVGDSATEAMRQWRNSSGHWQIITNSVYNFAGVGVAQDTQSGFWIWTVEFVRESTGYSAIAPTAAFTGSQVLPYNHRYRRAKVSWSGTAGSATIRDYRLQYRVNGHRWHLLLRATTRTSKAKRVRVGKTIQFRVRARDVNFVKGAWTLSSVISVQ
jgi:uncharacterized protein YkwD